MKRAHAVYSLLLSSVLFHLLVPGSVAAASAGQDLQVGEIQGNYLLQKAVQGFCPPELKVVPKGFGGRERGTGLGIYCANFDDCIHRVIKPDGLVIREVDNTVFEFDAVNAGAQLYPTESPMWGEYDGWYYSQSALIGNQLSGEKISIRNDGVLNWRDAISGTFEGQSFSYRLERWNNIPGTRGYSLRECVYLRKGPAGLGKS